MPSYLNVNSSWTGGNTRRLPASVSTMAQNGARFDVGFGVLYQVLPGVGSFNEIEILRAITLTETEFRVDWASTGGQNHRFWIRFQDASRTESTGGPAGPKDYSAVVVQLSDQTLGIS